MASLESIFGKGGFVPPLPPKTDPPEVQIAQAFEENDIPAPRDIRIDGKVHRFPTNGKRGDDAGWYVFYPGAIVAGAFGDWREGRDRMSIPFRAEIDRDMTPMERFNAQTAQQNAIKARNEADAKRHELAAQTVTQIWESLPPAPENNPYLVRKGVQPHGTRQTDDHRLVCPMYGADGKLQSLQYIKGDGEKRYQKDGDAKAFWMLGEPLSGRRIYLAEGFATAASIHEATGDATAIAYSAGNLLRAAKFLRATYGDRQEIVIVADNDESGTGQKSSAEAGEAIGAKVIIPPVVGDANDYAQAGNDLKTLLCGGSEPPRWLIPADEFCSQPSPLRWLIRKWIQRDALIMVHGPSGSGKTYVVLDWCLRIAGGMDEWCGQRVRNGPVVYLAGEGHFGLKSRIAAWKQNYGVNSLAMYLSSSGCDLNTPSGYQRVVEHIRSLPEKPVLIVVDTLHRFLLGDENSAQDAKTMLDACAALMDEFKCSVLLVHHTGLSDEHRARGSSAWRGALDIEINVMPGHPGEPFVVAQKKMKDDEEQPPVSLRLAPVVIDGWIDEDGKPVSSCVVVQDTESAERREKVDAKLAGFKQLFERSWFATGCEKATTPDSGDDFGRPFVSRMKMRKFLIENDGMSEAAARQSCKSNETNRFIGRLQAENVIMYIENEARSGWIVIDNPMTSSMLTRE